MSGYTISDLYTRNWTGRMVCHYSNFLKDVVQKEKAVNKSSNMVVTLLLLQ